ncbi:hypothetical protein [Clostridium grantii]|uniref:Uncharacterized protein n=1 Tax=Clostridium grantii DSM 8605 TaxID=1121316 RepID=A0A1M5XCH1_9CLOT|nr:hypothetical protein [Clostridium grantii]SHH97476.1 hypothetical protein SAMN02745207_03542 [Clostridium grantii DSM 8605]
MQNLFEIDFEEIINYSRAKDMGECFETETFLSLYVSGVRIGN